MAIKWFLRTVELLFMGKRPEELFLLLLLAAEGSDSKLESPRRKTILTFCFQALCSEKVFFFFNLILVLELNI